MTEPSPVEGGSKTAEPGQIDEASLALIVDRVANKLQETKKGQSSSDGEQPEASSSGLGKFGHSPFHPPPLS